MGTPTPVKGPQIRFLDDSASIGSFAVESSIKELNEAIRGGDVTRVKTITAELGKQDGVLAQALNDPSNHRMPLLTVCMPGRATTDEESQIAQVLLDAGANPNIKSASGVSALSLAAEHGKLEVCRALLRHKADINFRTDDGKSVLHFACSGEAPTELLSELVAAGGKVDAADQDRRTPLHLSARAGDKAQCKALLRLGANPQAVDASGQSVLHSLLKAFENKVAPIDVVVELLRRGVDPNSRDVEGNTSMHFASNVENDRALVKYLMVFGGQDLANTVGVRPSEIASEEVTMYILGRPKKMIETKTLTTTEFNYLKPSDGVYVGEWQDKLKSGQGEYLWDTTKDPQSSIVYCGQWTRDQHQGMGLTLWPSKEEKTVSYFGKFNQSEFGGHGSFIWEHGGEYEGEWKNHLPHGEGKYTWEDGCYYNGVWKDGMMHGDGEKTFSDQSIYKGQWEFNMPHGEGRYFWPHRHCLYQGQWQEGKMHGFGIMTWQTGQYTPTASYKGYWKEGKKHGKGVYTYEDGTVYDGVWYDDAMSTDAHSSITAGKSHGKSHNAAQQQL